MDQILDTSPSQAHPLLTDLRLVPLMRQLDISPGTFYPWLRGAARPPGRILLIIADTLSAPLPEVIQAFWREDNGDSCPWCDCGGKKVFPKDRPQARALVIELPCTQCGSIRRYYGRIGHSKLCKKCSLSADRVERVEFPCPGYRFHDDIRLRAKTCLPTIPLTPGQIRGRQRRKERNPNLSFDVLKRERQCRGCEGAAKLTASREKRVQKILKQYDLRIRIRNLKQLIALESEFAHDMNPNLIEAGTKNLKSMVRKSGHDAPGVSKAHVIRWWSQKKLPRFVHLGICIVCGNIAIRLNEVPRFHWLCYRKWTGNGRTWSKAIVPPRKGGYTDPENLKKYYSWVIQHHLGTYEVEERGSGRKRSVVKKKSFQDIANDNGASDTYVKRQIKFIIDRLVPDLLIPRWRLTAKFILDAAKKDAPRI